MSDGHAMKTRRGTKTELPLHDTCIVKGKKCGSVGLSGASGIDCLFLIQNIQT